MDEAVLAELRAIRQEIQHLADRVGSAATREELSGYVTVEAFKAHERAHDERAQGWRFWMQYVPTGVLFVLYLAQTFGLQVHLVTR